MNVIIIALLVVAIALMAVNLRKPTAPASSAAGESLSRADIESALASAQADALTRMMDQMRHEREAIADEARKAQNDLLALATENIVKQGIDQFGTKAESIDKGLRTVADQVTARMQEIDRAIDELRESNSRQYGTVEQAVATLSKRTDNLREVLSNSQARGQWGERLAEDMLRAAGFHEGINYQKQSTIDSGGRPDYRFDIPPNRVLYMDVKFPLDKYSEFVTTKDDAVRSAAQKSFIAAVKGHIDALAKRDYVNNSSDNTLDYVLMFVPNESISGFVHESDPTLIDYALDRKVVLCSPLTLYAFLVVIRQAADSFHTEKTAAEIMQLVNLFQRQWKEYTEAVDKVEKVFENLQDQLKSINTDGTRFKKLNAQIKKIEKLRTKQGIPELTTGADEDPIDDSDGE
ncbi:MAG: DNA recombination protein RmuC [Acidimicrobiia bacterium]